MEKNDTEPAFVEVDFETAPPPEPRKARPHAMPHRTPMSVESGLTEGQLWKRAFDDERVRAVLGHGVFQPIGATYIQGRDQSGEVFRYIKLVLYRYDSDDAVEVVMSLAGEVSSVRADSYQPPLAPLESRRAIAIARRHPAIARLLDGRVLDGHTLLVTPPPGSNVRGRFVDVRFSEPGSRMPFFKAMVKLNTGEVIAAGPVENGHDQVVDEHGHEEEE